MRALPQAQPSFPLLMQTAWTSHRLPLYLALHPIKFVIPFPSSQMSDAPVLQ